MALYYICMVIGPFYRLRGDSGLIHRVFMSDVMISNLPISANQHFFSQLVQDALAEAKKLGATDAVAQVSENRGLSVSVRKQKTENVEIGRASCRERV